MKKEKIVLASIEYSKSKPLAYVSGKLYLAKKRKNIKFQFLLHFQQHQVIIFKKIQLFLKLFSVGPAMNLQ